MTSDAQREEMWKESEGVIYALARDMARRGLFVRDDFGAPDIHAIKELVAVVGNLLASRDAALRAWTESHLDTVSCPVHRADLLSFHALREANVRRCEAVFHPLAAWSLTDWATAAAGELGEACNVIKKMRRAESSHNPPEQNIAADEGRRMLAHEIADTVIYLDLLAARAGIVLEDAVREKFNLVSAKNKSSIRLDTLPAPDGDDCPNCGGTGYSHDGKGR